MLYLACFSGEVLLFFVGGGCLRYRIVYFARGLLESKGGEGSLFCMCLGSGGGVS